MELKSVQSSLEASQKDLVAQTNGYAAEKDHRTRLQSDNKALSSSLAQFASQLEREMSLVSELKVEVVQTEQRVMSVAERVAAQATDIAAMAFKAQLSEASDEFNTRLANASSMAQLAETQRVATEKK